MLCALMEFLSHDSAKSKDRNSYGFQMLHFHWSFSSDIVAVKGVSTMFTYCHHQSGFCIKMGSCETHLNTAVIVKGEQSQGRVHTP